MKKNEGDNPFLTKAGLYAMVSEKAKDLGFNLCATNYRIDAMELAHKICLDLTIEILDFKEATICGILYKGTDSTYIALNNRRSATGKNFDCMHELIHYMFHNRNHFVCNTNVDDHLEWQANEGAAQFLVPFQSFIPNYCKLYDQYNKQMPADKAHKNLISHLSRHYMVGELVITYRLNQLKSEIIQYLDGVDINCVQIRKW
ncbi:MAG: ImmA/IrrE family metallo-endopeptidase [Defluviitaleaceae bacterium]|nr:ImmA/IrrE family metallo-endopeptidase [Defluviitaleaceae bacterium]